MRKVVHIDMDAFYAAVEQRDDPALRGLPLAVAWRSRRGVVLTASYAARAHGVRSAMPVGRALGLCPDLVLVPPRFEAYRVASQAIRAVMLRATPLVEPLALDEAYLDVTGLGPSATAIARTLKAEIRAETGLTASAGVSYNKFLAKAASDLDKPDGLAVIRPEGARAFLAGLPIQAFHGIGPAFERRLRAAGIHRGADLQALPEAAIVDLLGNPGRHFWRLARGEDPRPVEPDRARKSLSVETTYDFDLTSITAVEAALEPLAADLAERLRQSLFAGSTLVLKLRYADYRRRSRQTTAAGLDAPATILLEARRLARRAPLEGPVRLLGLGVGRGDPIRSGGQFALPLE